MRKTELLGAPERRTVAASDFELRAVGNNILTFTGYASVFNSPYDVFGGPDRGGWSESVDRKAFDKTLKEKPDVHLLINHEGMPLARTRSGTLQLSTDRQGLRVDAELDRRDPDVQALEVKMGRGDMDEMSFAFRTVRQEWNDDESERRLLEVNIDRGDVSVVNFGASPTTSSQLRAALDMLADLDIDESVLAEARSLDDLVGRAATGVLALRRAMTPEQKRTLSRTEVQALINT